MWFRSRCFIGFLVLESKVDSSTRNPMKHQETLSPLDLNHICSTIKAKSSTLFELLPHTYHATVWDYCERYILSIIKTRLFDVFQSLSQLIVHGLKNSREENSKT